MIRPRLNLQAIERQFHQGERSHGSDDLTAHATRLLAAGREPETLLEAERDLTWRERGQRDGMRSEAASPAAEDNAEALWEALLGSLVEVLEAPETVVRDLKEQRAWP